MRGRLVGGAAVGCALLVGGWLIASGFESPSQREARARPPAPRPILVRVIAGVLAEEVTARADVEPRITTRLIPAELSERAVVTGRRVTRGETVRPGDAVTEISGRPVIVLPGRFAFYRTIGPGANGPDVAQLQRGLAAAGVPPVGDPPGSYGVSTQQAVTALYRSVGVTPLTEAVRRPVAGDPKRRQTTRVPIVPLTEAVVAGHLPARLASQLPVGARPQQDKPIATLEGGELVAHAGIASSVVGRLKPGLSAELIADDGRTLGATVRRIGAKIAKTEDLQDVTLERSGRRDLPGSWNRLNVLARITVRLVHSESLIVPSRAVARSADGRAHVTKQAPGSRLVRVQVRVLGDLTGRSAVAPAVSGTLTTRDRVVVG